MARTVVIHPPMFAALRRCPARLISSRVASHSAALRWAAARKGGHAESHGHGGRAGCARACRGHDAGLSIKGSASASQVANDNGDGDQRLVVIHRDESVVSIDNPPEGFSQGDEQAISGPLFTPRGERSAFKTFTSSSHSLTKRPERQGSW